MLLYILNLEKCIQYIKFGEIYSIFIEFEEICTINLKEKRSGNPETRTQTKKKKKEKKQHCRKLLISSIIRSTATCILSSTSHDL
jgi:hypothetical protein